MRSTSSRSGFCLYNFTLLRRHRGIRFFRAPFLLICVCSSHRPRRRCCCCCCCCLRRRSSNSSSFFLGLGDIGVIIIWRRYRLRRRTIHTSFMLPRTPSNGNRTGIVPIISCWRPRGLMHTRRRPPLEAIQTIRMNRVLPRRRRRRDGPFFGRHRRHRLVPSTLSFPPPHNPNPLESRNP